MKRKLLIFDLDNTLIDRSMQPVPHVHPALFSKIQADAAALGVQLDFALITNSCYESAREWVPDFAHLYFENGAVRLVEGQIQPQLTTEQAHVALIRDVLQNILVEQEPHIAAVSWKHFTVAIHGHEAGFIRRILPALQACVKPLGWMALASGATTIEIGPIFLDKTFALDRILATSECYDEIVFIGDKMFPGGNDYALAMDPRVHTAIEVAHWRDTGILLSQLKDLDFNRALDHTTARHVVPQSDTPNFASLRTDVRTIFLDFDGTLTTQGSQIYHPNIEVFHRLHEEGRSLWIVTGRSLGWCDMMLQALPIDGIIGENGAFALFWDKGQIKRWTSPAIPAVATEQLQALKKTLMERFPYITWASDQNFRAYDLAIVTAEHGTYLSPAQIDELAACARSFGASYSVSSIHINIWMGSYNKAQSLLDFFGTVRQISYQQIQKQGLFIGDSPNDESLFRLLQNSFSVANIHEFIDQLQYKPRYIARGFAGEGSHEILRQLLRAPLDPLPDDRYAISLVIPCFEELAKLENSLKSYAAAAHVLLETKGLKAEVVLVDNNSGNAAAIAQLAQRYRQHLDLVLVHQPALPSTFSLCSARNRGVMNARGSLILFTDSDCMIAPDFLVEALRFVDQSSLPQHWIVTGERVFVQTPRNIPEATPSLFSNLPPCPSPSNYGLTKDRRFPWMEQLPAVEHPWNFVHGCFMLMKKSVYLAVGGSNTDYDGHWGYEEIDLAHEIVRQLQAQIFYSPLTKVYHQEFPEDALKIQTNAHRTGKSQNPNWQRVCRKIEGFEDFKARQFARLGISMH
ncbi:MAG TPA: HAD-IIB family hydrolase [Oligoflexus sp.]|uniref:HAD-IIB family hydrolase n=1 Tax=Oligoflexus sp. TaxID=1971216 RepID=UPI002D6C75EB|nr:HAD-IIB family hydrolase [Oligoflexus sp.]HYX37559.1 HAD-IIB family hydrolase [Oligoflexus sp.]